MSKAETINECEQPTKINGQFWCEELNRQMPEADGKPLCPSNCPVRIARLSDENAPNK